MVDKSSVQYAYAYPQYYVLRQDDEGSSPWYVNIQNWFQNLGGGGESGSEGGEDGDAAIDTDAPVVTKSGINIVEANKVKPVEKNEKYIYLTPASTTVLNPEKRFFILPDQQKILGSISGPALSPIYSLQPLLSRSSSSSSSIVSSEPAVIVPNRNVPNILPIQPVIPAVELPILLKSRIEDGLNAAKETPENRVVPVNEVQTRAGVDVDDEGTIINSISSGQSNQLIESIPTKEPVASSAAIQQYQSFQQLQPLPNFPLPASAAIESIKTVAQSSSKVESVSKDVINDDVPAPVAVSDESKAKRDTVLQVQDSKPLQTSVPFATETAILTDNSFNSAQVVAVPTPPATLEFST